MKSFLSMLACLLALWVASPLCCCAGEKPSQPTAQSPAKEECCCCQPSSESKQERQKSPAPAGDHACLCATKAPKQAPETALITPPADSGMDLPPVRWLALLTLVFPEPPQAQRDPRQFPPWTTPPPPSVRRALLVSRVV